MLPPGVLVPPGPASAASQIVGGATLGLVYPVRPDPGIVPVDGRTVALRWLGDYVCSQVYARPGAAAGPLATFSIPRDQFFTEDPGPEADEMKFPSIAAIGQDAPAMLIGFTPSPDEQTKDVYGQGTVVWPLYTHVEKVRLQCWSSDLAELRGIVSGVESAMTPTEGRGGIVVTLAGYFGQNARFALAGTEWPPGGGMAVRNRRFAFVDVELELLVVNLVSYVPLNPFVVVDTEIPKYSDPRVALNVDDDSDSAS